VEAKRTASESATNLTDSTTSRRMRATAGRDNAAERALRSALHATGLRFRIHRRLLPGSTRTTDVVLPRAQVAVFVDGCFWHGCPIHGTWPKRNSEWWRAKIDANRRRDRDTDTRLSALGWEVVRIWEHEDPIEAAARIAMVVRSRLALVGATRRR